MPRLTITEIAKEVGVHKSTVSRQARANNLVDERGLVDLEEYRKLREDGLDPVLQTSGPGAKASTVEDGKLATERAGLLAAQRERAELDLAARKGELVPVAGVERATEDLFRRVRDAVMAVPEAEAEAIALLGDPGAIAGHLTLRLEAALDDARRAIADAVGRAA